MGIIGFLRNRGGLIIGVIGLALVAFLAGDAMRTGSVLFGASQNTVGEVAGKTIDIESFSKKLDQAINAFKQQMGGTLNPQMTAYAQENAWNQEVSSILMEKEAARLGLSVGKDEFDDMVSGKNPDPQIVQSFSDPKTGQFDRDRFAQFFQSIKGQDDSNPMVEQWRNFLINLKSNRLSQKYNNLVKNSVYVTSLEAKEDYDQRNKLSQFNYVMLPYSSVPDKDAKPSESDYQEYYDANKAKFVSKEETRSIEYVVIDANPSKADTAEMQTRMNKLAAELAASKNDSLFVGINSDSKLPVDFIRKGMLDPKVDTLVFNAAPGTLVGPVFSNGRYTAVKVLDVKSQPDSVRSSHILFNVEKEGGQAKAQAKADSVASLIRKGASFTELSNKFSTDVAAKAKNGDIGYTAFDSQNIDRTYKAAIFDGKVGDIKVVTSQFGVHIIKITDQKKFSKAAKVALVDKALVSSSATQQAAYAKATKFLGSLGDSKDFAAAAKKSDLTSQVAEGVTGSQSVIPGLDNPRSLVKWMFKAKEGDVSDDVFELDNKYVVAKVTEIRQAGQVPLNQVKKQIEPFVINLVKARKLTEKVDKALAGSSTIAQVGQKLGVAVTPVQNVVFANPVIPGLSQENKVIGTVFGLKPNKMSKAIDGEQGVYVVSLVGFSNPAPLTNTVKQKQQIAQNLAQRIPSETFKVLKDKGDVKDYRVKFY